MVKDRPLGPLFSPLVAHIAAYEGEVLALSFAQIERMVGAPMPMAMRVQADNWSTRGATARALRAVGWRARLDYPQR